MEVRTQPTEGFEETISPFGGIHPKIELPTEEIIGNSTPKQVPPLDKLSLVDDESINPNALSVVEGDKTVANVTGTAANNRIDRYSFAIGKDFSKEDIDFAVRNGHEEWLRQSVANKKNLAEEEAKAVAIRNELSKGLPSDANEQSLLFANVKALNDYVPNNNPKTVVEKAYAEEYIRKIPETGPDGGVTQKLISQIADRQADKDSEERIRSATDVLLTTEEIGKRGVMWQEIAKKHAEDQAEKVKGEGWVEWLYEGSKKNVLPFYDWYQTHNAIPGIKADGFLQGDSLASQILQLHRLTPDQLDKTLEDLRNSPWAKDHPHEAERFLDAVVSYGGSDQFIDNLFSGVDLLGAASGAGKLSKAVEKGLASRAARKEFEAAVANTTSYQPKFGPDGSDFASEIENKNKRQLFADISRIEKEQNKRELLLNDNKKLIEYATERGVSVEEMSDLLKTNYKNNKPRLDYYKSIHETIADSPKPKGMSWENIDTTDSVVVATADHIKANADPHATMGERLEAVGDIKNASIANAVQNAEGLLKTTPGPTTPLTLRQIASSLPSFVNPLSWMKPSLGASAARSANLQNHIATSGQQVLDRIKELLVVNRLPEEALQMAFKMEEEDFSRQLNFNVNNAVQNITRTSIGPVAPVNNPVKVEAKVRPEETFENVGRVEFTLTKPDGSQFSNPQEVIYWGEKMYGLNLGDFGARQVGNGWEMTVSRALDETRPEVRDVLITTNNKTPFSLVAFLKSGGARVSEFNANNRLAYLSGQQGLVEAMKDLANNLRLNAKDWTKVNRVMQEDMQRPNPFDPQQRPGKFLDTVQDFGVAYRRLNGHAPTDREVNAYFTAVKVNEIEHHLRNASLLKEYSRLGLKEVTLRTQTVDPSGKKIFGSTDEFKGKIVKDLPTGKGNSKADAVVVIYNEGMDPIYRPLSVFTGGDGKSQLKDLQVSGYKIIQTANPVRNPGKEIFKDGPPVNFIITKDFTIKELNHNQLPYREGWHQSYDYGYYVKQAGIRKVENYEFVNGSYVPNGTFTHVFEGDITHSGYRTEGEARKFAKAMDDARKLAFHTPGSTAAQLDAFLSQNLPYTSKQFLALFTPDPKTGKAIFEKNNPFLHVGNGETTSDLHWNNLKGSFTDLVDAIRTPWNLVNQVDKKFVGARDELLHTIREEGSQANPVFKLQSAETIDPYSAMSQAMTNIMRNRFMIDYRIQSVESYIKEFGHLYGDIPEEDLYSNALDYLYQPVPIKNLQGTRAAEANAAENARRAIIELLGHETEEGHLVELFKSMMVEKVYEKLGQKASDWASQSAIRKSSDPLKVIRSAAFHSAIGLFNVFQGLQNSMTFAQIVAISPQHGAASMMASILNYGAMKTNTNPAIVNKLADFAHTFGFDKQYFKEWHKEFKMSGRFSVEGEHAWQGDMEGPALHQTLWGKSLDKSAVFFKETERMIRTLSHATAFLEWRTANPNDKITGEVRNQILSRSNVLAGNMTKDQYAMWQQGWRSTSTQFWSYQARLSEMILNPKEGRGDRLSFQEKAQLVLANSVLYGAPVGGLGTVFGGAFNPYDDIKQAAIKHGIDIKDEIWEGFEKGLVGAAAHLATGRSSDLNERLGPTGHSLWDTFTETPMLDFMFGVAGKKAVGIWKSATPLVNDILFAIKGEDHPPALRDLVDVLQNISSVDQMVKLHLWFANKDKIAYDKKGLQLGELDNDAEALIWGFSGALPSELGADWALQAIMKDREATIKKIDAMVQRELLIIDKAREDKNAEAIKNGLARIRVLTSGHTYQEAKKLFREGISAHKTLHDKVDRQWYLNAMNPDNKGK